MLSKRKITEATMTWIREQLEDARGRGISLRDDFDGVAIRVDQVRQSDTHHIFLDISAISDDGSILLEYCLLLQQKLLPGLSQQPTAKDLADIDDTP